MPRARIDLDAIVEAAVVLGDAHGLDAITARNLAAALGVTPMALYRHVPSLGALNGLLFERVVEAGALLDHTTSGLEPWLVETFARVRDALLAHPWALGLAGTTAGHGLPPLRFVEAVLARLSAGSVPATDAARVFHAALAYTLGASSIEAAARRSRDGDAALAGGLPPAQTPLRDFPHVRAAMPTLARFASDRVFRDGLGRLVRAMLEPPAAKPAKRRRRP